MYMRIPYNGLDCSHMPCVAALANSGFRWKDISHGVRQQFLGYDADFFDGAIWFKKAGLSDTYWLRKIRTGIQIL